MTSRHFLGAFIFLVFVAVLLTPSLFDSPDKTLLILVSGDFERDASGRDFANEAWTGVQQALDYWAAKDPAHVFSLQKFFVSTRGLDEAASEVKFSKAIAEQLAKNKPVAIISADISGRAAPLARAAAMYRLPVFLVVATNDKVYPFEKPGSTFRLVPNDSAQATRLASWCKDFKRPAIIHGVETQYGKFLGERTVQILASSGEPPLVFRYENDTDFLPILQRLDALGCDSITFIGYYPRLLEFAGKLTAIKNYKPAILLSDGCYSSDLISNSWSKDFCLSFPVPPRDLNPIADNGNIGTTRKAWVSATGVGILAADAASMIVMTANEQTWRLSDRASFLEAFSRLNRVAFGPPEVSQPYLFLMEKLDPSEHAINTIGDNLKAEFWVFKLNEDDLQ